MTYNPDSTEQLVADLITIFEDEYGNPATSEGDITYGLLYAVASTLAQNQEQALEQLYDAAYLQTATGEDLTRRARNVGIERKPPVAATGVVTFSRDSAATQDYTIPAGTEVSTPGADAVFFETTENATLNSGSTSVDATVEAVEAGQQGNVAADTITIGASSITGVDSVTNAQATGNRDFTDTDGNPLIQGRGEESDEALRSRALDTTNLGGAATPSAIYTAINSIVDVRDGYVDVDTTNDTVEAVIYGGDPQDIGRALFETVGVTTETVGGTYGTQQSYTVETDALPSGQRTLYWSEPTITNVDMTIDVAVTEAYVGDDNVRDAIIEYIGGLDSNGRSVRGEVGVGDDVYLSEIENVVERDGYGVVGVTGLTTTPASTTNTNGLDVVSIGTGAVAESDGSDSSITINTAQV